MRVEVSEVLSGVEGSEEVCGLRCPGFSVRVEGLKGWVCELCGLCGKVSADQLAEKSKNRRPGVCAQYAQSMRASRGPACLSRAGMTQAEQACKRTGRQSKQPAASKPGVWRHLRPKALSIDASLISSVLTKGKEIKGKTSNSKESLGKAKGSKEKQGKVKKSMDKHRKVRKSKDH